MRAADLRLTEQATARVANGGAPPALEIGRLYAEHHRLVAALCRLLLRDPAEAEDATQQTFLLAFSSMIGGTVPRNPGPWLATIARRECWARTARRRELPLDEERAPAARAGDPVDEAIRKADVAALWSAIESLPRQQRKAFLMREFSGLTYAEVAQALGATEAAVESLLVRARRQLRDGLESIGTATNRALTPLVLLHHRLARLFGGRGGATAGGAALAGIPAAAKLAAVTVAVVALGSAGAGLGVVAASSGGSRAGSPAPAAATVAFASPLVSRVPAAAAGGAAAVFGVDPSYVGPDGALTSVPAGILAPPPAADPGASMLSAPGPADGAAPASQEAAPEPQPAEPSSSAPAAAPAQPGAPTPEQPAAPTTDAASTADSADPAPTEPSSTDASSATTDAVAPAPTDPAATDPTATDPVATDTTATDASATDTTQTDTTP